MQRKKNTSVNGVDNQLPKNPGLGRLASPTNVQLKARDFVSLVAFALVLPYICLVTQVLFCTVQYSANMLFVSKCSLLLLQYPSDILGN